MKSPRIAIFDEWWPLHIGDEVNDPAVDEPTSWARFSESPKLKGYVDGHYVVDDHRAIDEIHRLIKFKTCPICRVKMGLIPEYSLDDLLLCMKCGYWGGRGYRDWGSHFMQSIHPPRGVISRYKPLSPIDKEKNEYLITHLRRFPRDMTKISPLRVERFVVDLLADYLDCEVKAIGGSKDNGVDGYILKGNVIRSIVQVKWRQDMNRAEGVKVVREVAGTLLARGIPSGILVSNRVHYSKPAIAEAESISKLHITELGKMNLSLYDYHTIIDMLEISNTKLTAKMSVDDWFKISDRICVFDGASSIPRSSVVRKTEGQSFTIQRFLQDITSDDNLCEDEIVDVVQRARHRNKEAMETLLRLEAIRLICRRIVNSPRGWWTTYFTDYEDLSQEVRFLIYQKLPNHKKFKSAANFFRWVITIAHNVYITGMRKNRPYFERRVGLNEASAVGVEDLGIALVTYFGEETTDGVRPEIVKSD